jgi:putative transcriptional regulator
MIRIQPGEIDVATRAALASGRADAAVALFIDSVLAMRGIENLFGDMLAGSLLEREGPASMSPDALERTIARIDAAASETPRAPKPSRLNEIIRIPAALRQAIDDAEQTRGWRSAGPGVKQLKLGLSESITAEILRIDAGAAVPKHTHHGRELTLCLVGGFSDERASYGPGDVSFADPTLHHTPRADADGFCYVLAITDAGLKFDGALGAIQKLFGG